ncbi:MAG TPA: tetratricopeptide repeat protein [Balneolaceae bacterium]|nr:tetratricopeptide repeat protein [Balneolaceae bacterium]
MIYTTTRKAVPVLIGIVFGIFFATACATFISPLEKAEQNFNEKNYDAALQNLNQYIQEHPNDAEALLYKLRVLDESAKSLASPSERTGIYRDMKNTSESIHFMDASEETITEADSVIAIARNREQQNGIELLQKDESEVYDQNFEEIIYHLENALILDSRNETVYNLKATTYYRHGDIDKALSTLETGVEILPEASDELIEKLAYFYLESGKIDNAIRSYENLLENSPENQNYLHGLVNSYILGNQHGNAIELLENLVTDDPDNELYKQTLASEILFDLNEKIDKALTEKEVTTGLTAERITLLYTRVEDLNSERSVRQVSDFESNHSVAGLYKNSAFRIYELARFVSAENEDEADDLRRVADNFLRSSLSVWEKLAEDNPENTDVARNLYQVYVQLNMKDNADMIRKNFNF